MGDLRFLAPYERVRSADDRVETLRRLGDLDVVAALAAASFERDPLLANVLATEAMNRMRRHGTIVETAAEGLLSLDAGGHVTFLNPAAAALFGYGPEELLGRNIESFFQPVRAEAPTPGGGSFLERVLHRQEALRNLETRVRRADGELVPVMASAAPILREGATEGAVVTLTDLSDRRRVEEALLEATTKRSLEQDRLRTVLDLLPVGVIIADPTGRIVMTNRAAKTIWGTDTPKPDGVKDYGLYRAWDVKTGRRLAATEWGLARALLEGEHVLDQEVEIEAFDGKRRIILNSAVPLQDAEGRVIGAVAVNLDLTERRQAERSLRTPADLHGVILDGVTDYAVFLMDPQGRVTTWNQGAELLKGWRREDIIGWHYSVLFPPEAVQRGDPWKELEVAARESRFEQEGTRIRKDGTLFEALVILRALRDPEGRLLGFVKVTKDITERKRAERALEAHAHRLEDSVRDRGKELRHAVEELEAFNYLVGHDLKEPLRAMDAYLRALEEDYGTALDPGARSLLDASRDASRRMKTLLDGLLELSRASRDGDLQVRPVTLREALANEACATRYSGLVAERGVHLEVAGEPDAACLATPHSLCQILGNLILNAVAHNKMVTPRVRVTAKRPPGSASTVVFTVEDNGEGFPADLLARFRPDGGGGLPSLPGGKGGFGLIIAQRVAERLGGTLRLGRSSLGGAAVEVTLPAAPTQTAN